MRYILTLLVVVLFSACNIESGSSGTMLNSDESNVDSNSGVSQDPNSGSNLDPTSYGGNGSPLNDAEQGEGVPAIPLADLGLGSFG